MEYKHDNLPFILSYSFRDISGKEVQSYRSRLPVLPASNMKILTGFAAFNRLGMNHEFITEVRRDGSRVIFSGGPSPLLDSNSLQQIVSSLNIGNGNSESREIVLRNTGSRIDRMSINPSWNYEDSNYSYQPRITNFSLNENCIPKPGLFHEFSLQDLHESEDSFVPVRNPALAMKHGILNAIENTLLPGDSGTEAVTVHAEKLEDILEHMETVSCNYSAEVIFKYLSFAQTGIPGSWKDSSRALTEGLANFLGYDPGISVNDGSGLSRSNFLKTSILSDLLMKIHQNDGDQFIGHLPVPGKGTLRNRLKKWESEKIHAKTGSLTGVAALSGYIYSRDVAFSIIINNYLGADKISYIIDRILGSFLSGNEVSSDWEES